MFVVKKISTGTKQNPNFAGDIHTWYIGKDGYVHKSINEFGLEGWKRKSSAQKYIDQDRMWSDGLSLAKYWHSQYEIVEK